MTRVGFLFICLLALPVYGQPRELTLKEAFDLAEKTNPALAAAHYRETAAENSIGIAKSGYLPSLSFEAVESSGFPGSSGLTGVAGLMGSPYRSGPAYGVVAKETLWDFGRTSNSVLEAEENTRLEKEDTKITAVKVKRAVLSAFYDCSRFKAQRDTWAELAKEIQLTSREVGRFVKTGQRSVVERYLVDSQSEEALTSQSTFDERFKVAIHRLALLTGLEENGLSCPALLQTDRTPQSARVVDSPYVTRAVQETKVAYAQVKRAKADHLPTLVAVGSLGQLDQARLVEKQDYAVGVGLIFPLFDGFKTTREVERAEARISEKVKELDQTKLELQEFTARFDEVIRGSQVKLNHLEQELTLAEKAYKLAKQRYFDLQGTLIDLREALKNLTRIKVELNNTRADFLQASTEKAVVNGNY